MLFHAIQNYKKVMSHGFHANSMLCWCGLEIFPCFPCFPVLLQSMGKQGEHGETMGSPWIPCFFPCFLYQGYSCASVVYSFSRKITLIQSKWIISGHIHLLTSWIRPILHLFDISYQSCMIKEKYLEAYLSNFTVSRKITLMCSGQIHRPYHYLYPLDLVNLIRFWHMSSEGNYLDYILNIFVCFCCFLVFPGKWPLSDKN